MNDHVINKLGRKLFKKITVLDCFRLLYVQDFFNLPCASNPRCGRTAPEGQGTSSHLDMLASPINYDCRIDILIEIFLVLVLDSPELLDETGHDYVWNGYHGCLEGL